MISIVIPLLNEEQNLKPLYAELTVVLKKLKKQYEIIFLDDGSTDDSLQTLQQLAKSKKNIRIFSFRKNLGKAEVLTYGFAKAKGEYIVTLDADLQDQPSEIEKLVIKTKEGWDVVCGWRKDRKDSIIKVWSSKLFNNIASIIFRLSLHDYNCGLKVFTKDAAKSLRLYGGLHRFIPVIASQHGFRVTEVPVEHKKRKFGKSKYGFSKLWTELPDMFTMLFLIKYSKRPLHFFGVIGSLATTIGLLMLAYLAIIHFFFGARIGNRPMLFAGGLLLSGGLQVFFTGFLADLIINISHQSQPNGESMKNYLTYSSDGLQKIMPK